MKIKLLCLLEFLVFMSLISYSQTTISLFPSADTEMNQNGGGSFAGSSGAFQIYPWTPSFSKRAAIRFDLSAYAGCTINSAWLVMMEQSTNTISRQINVHRVTRSWAENSTHWTTPWTTSGGDYAASAVASFTPVWTGVYKKDSANLTTSVQNFVDGTYTNYGWILKIATEDNTQQYWAYYSKETATASFRPILRIRYSGCSPLPVELLNFDARCISTGQIELRWQTASEVNNDYFTIENSIDGISWTEIKEIKGAGNSNTLLTYSTVDEQPFTGISYYRLKQTDFDGKFSYSSVKDVNVVNEKPSVMIYPNPSQDIVIINGDEAELDQTKIVNLLGQDVTHQTKEIRNSRSVITFDVKDLYPGIYYIKTKNTVNKIYKQ